MENAADALKMAFAIFVFILALTITFSLFSKVKATADSVLFYSDKTNYYEKSAGTLKQGRIVTVDTIITTLKNMDNLYVQIEINGGYEEFTIHSAVQEIDNIISELLKDTNATYFENIYEIKVNGKYKKGEDGTKVTIVPGDTRTYVTYTKNN